MPTIRTTQVIPQVDLNSPETRVTQFLVQVDVRIDIKRIPLVSPYRTLPVLSACRVGVVL